MQPALELYRLRQAISGGKQLAEPPALPLVLPPARHWLQGWRDPHHPFIVVQEHHHLHDVFGEQAVEGRCLSQAAGGAGTLGDIAPAQHQKSLRRKDLNVVTATILENLVILISEIVDRGWSVAIGRIDAEIHQAIQLHLGKDREQGLTHNRFPLLPHVATGSLVGFQIQEIIHLPIVTE